MHRLLILIAAILLMVELRPDSIEQVANALLYGAMYCVFILGIAICCYALRPSFGAHLHGVALLCGFLSVAWVWGVYEGKMLPDSRVVLVLAILHSVLFAVFVHSISENLLSIRENWKSASASARKSATQMIPRVGLVAFLILLFSFPILIPSLHAGLS